MAADLAKRAQRQQKQNGEQPQRRADPPVHDTAWTLWRGRQRPLALALASLGIAVWIAILVWLSMGR